MSRDLNSDLITQITSEAFRPFFAIQATLDSTNLRLWTGLGDLSISGITYTGVGEFLSIGDLEEASDISVKGLSLTLSGIPSDLISLALNTPYQGRELTMYFGVTDLQRVFLLQENGSFLLLETDSRITVGDDDAPAQMFRGFIDTMTIEEGAETASISVSVENRLIDLERTRIFRYTDQSQKAVHPNDKGLEFVEDLQDKTFNWGRG